MTLSADANGGFAAGTAVMRAVGRFRRGECQAFLPPVSVLQDERRAARGDGNAFSPELL